MPHKPPPHTTQSATSADLEWGSDSLSRIYKAMTPGQEDAGIFFPKEDIIKTGNQYKLVSKSGGKNLGTYDTKAAAKKRERQVQYFKRQENTDMKESYLTEFGDRPYSWRMTVSQTDHYQAQFTIPENGMVYKVSMWATKWPKPKSSNVPAPPPLPVQWEFGFGLWKAADHAWNSPVKGVDDIVGGTGVAIPVFATVVAIFKEMVKRAKPLSIVYSAKGQSRARLYSRFTRMIQRIVPGYKGVEVKPGSYEVRHSRYANMAKMGIVPEERTMNIPTFKEYLQEALLLEGPAADFEQYICDAWNHLYGPASLRLKGKDPAGENLIPGSSSAVKKQALGAYTPTWEKPNKARLPDQAAAISIAKALKKQDGLPTGNLLKRTPDGRLTRQYTAAGGTNATSKTDILLVKPGSGAATEYRYSLKVAPAALMSGLWGDANAVFQIAQQKYTAAGGTVDVSGISKILSAALDKIHIPDGLAGSSDAAEYLDPKHMTKPSSSNKKNEPRSRAGYNIIKTGRRKGKEAQGTLDYLVTIGVMTRDGTLVAPAQRSAKFKKLPADIQKFLNTVALREVGIKGKLQQEMKKAFDNNTDFRAQFVYEAASGHGKFGKKAPQTANRFLKFTTSGTLEDTSTFASAKSPKIVSIAEKIRFRFRWKHRQGALAIDMLKNEEVHEPTYQDMLAEHWGMLETTMLNEGWFSDVKTSAKAIWNKFKSWITNFIRAVLQKLHAAATKGYQAVMDFLGFEIAHATLERDVPV